MITIPETISALQSAVTKALPGMEVTVNISIRPLDILTASLYPKEEKADVKIDAVQDETSLDLDGVRLMLNGYVAAVGTEKAFVLVEKYTTGGTRNPADIPEADYVALIKEIDVAEINLSKKPSGEA